MAAHCWYQRQKELKLKANHNQQCVKVFFCQLVSKIERTEIESKSQHSCKQQSVKGCWYQRQKELKLKANHNTTQLAGNAIAVGIKDRKN